MASLEANFEVWTLQRTPTRDRSFKADLHTPDFGLGHKEWAFLEQKMDEVLHLAADLNLALSFSKLFSVNVQASASLARLGKPFHFASSLTATLSSTRPSLHGELEPQAVIIGGYAQSKWAAEAVLEQLALPGYTFRLGQLLGTPDTKEWLSLVIRGLRELGCFPKFEPTTPLYFDFTPLEWAADKLLRHLGSAVDRRVRKVIRRGWALHFRDLLQALEANGVHLEETAPNHFFHLESGSLEGRAAQRALVKLHPERKNSGWEPYDLFLLGNASSACLERSASAALTHLTDYVASALTLSTE